MAKKEYVEYTNAYGRKVEVDKETAKLLAVQNGGIVGGKVEAKK